MCCHGLCHNSSFPPCVPSCLLWFPCVFLCVCLCVCGRGYSFPLLSSCGWHTCTSSPHQLLQRINPGFPPSLLQIVPSRPFRPVVAHALRPTLALSFVPCVYLCADVVPPCAPDSPSPASLLAQLISHLPTRSLSAPIPSSVSLSVQPLDHLHLKTTHLPSSTF